MSFSADSFVRVAAAQRRQCVDGALPAHVEICQAPGLRLQVGRSLQLLVHALRLVPPHQGLGLRLELIRHVLGGRGRGVVPGVDGVESVAAEIEGGGAVGIDLDLAEWEMMLNDWIKNIIEVSKRLVNVDASQEYGGSGDRSP